MPQEGTQSHSYNPLNELWENRLLFVLDCKTPLSIVWLHYDVLTHTDGVNIKQVAIKVNQS